MDLYAENRKVTVPTLMTERLTLRAMRPQDASAITVALNDIEVSKWLTVVPYPYTLADAEWFINECAEGRANAWLIWHGDQLAGTVGMDDELGYWLARAAWGKGFATEAAGAVVAHHFATTDIDVIRSGHFVENSGSRNVLEKLGFVEVGAHAHFSKARNADVPGRSVELTRARWAALQNA